MKKIYWVCVIHHPPSYHHHILYCSFLIVKTFSVWLQQNGSQSQVANLWNITTTLHQTRRRPGGDHYIIYIIYIYPIWVVCDWRNILENNDWFLRIINPWINVQGQTNNTIPCGALCPCVRIIIMLFYSVPSSSLRPL